jgi:spore maturation protein CgeB/GT2 family glycosyltransferase
MEDGSQTTTGRTDAANPGAATDRPDLAPRRRRVHGQALELELLAARRELVRLDDRLRAATEQLRAAKEQLEVVLGQRALLLASEEKLGLQLEEHRRRLRELEQLNSTLTVTLGQVKNDVERAADSRAWRWGHFATTLGWRLRGRQVRTQGALAAAIGRISRAELETRGLPAPANPRALPPAASSRRAPGVVRAAPLPLNPEDELKVERYRSGLAAELRRRLGPTPERRAWPSVTAVIPTRDGRLELERLMRGLLEHTDYPELEVIVVDNDSADGTLEYLNRLETSFSLKIVAGAESMSFSEANAIGAHQAAGELLLFLNNDVEPFEAGWLRELVTGLDATDVDAVGATLIHAETSAVAPDAEPLVQHRSIALRWEDQIVRPYNVGDGASLWDCAFGIEQRCAAVTAACMLIRGDTFESLGGFDRAYRFGLEDVDIGMKLAAGGGRMSAVGRAVLTHRESSTQMREDSDIRRANREHNRRVLLERWGPSMVRAYRLGRLHRDPFWTDGRGPHVAITLTDLDPDAGWGDWYTAHELGGALEGIGWRVTYGQRRGDAWYEFPDDLDYVLTLMDPFDARRVPAHVTVIAWIRNWTERWLEQPWFERLDVLLASSTGSVELIEQATGRRPTFFPLATNPAVFAPAAADPAFVRDYVYTGNRWGEERAVERAVSPTDDEEFSVFGRGWDKNKRLGRFDGGPIAHDQLPRVYAGAKLVLDDTQSPTLPYGALNARVFDAVAAGALPITDCTNGARDLFDEEFPVWHDAKSLREQIDRLLGDEALRRSLVRRYRGVVLRDHTYSRRADQLRRMLIDGERRLSFAIKIGAPDRTVAVRWGDLHFAEALARELRRRGHRTLVQTIDEWDDEEGLRRDVVVHLRGLSHYTPRPGQFNVLWSISHPADLTGPECDGFDLVCAASQAFAAELEAGTSAPVVVLQQATDPRVFKPDPTPEAAHELVYVANSRNVLRPIPRDLLPTDRDLAVFGANWQGLIDASYVLAEHVPNDALRHIYSSAGIVLCDHWDDMREKGYISNRIFDALACGAFVLSDDVEGLEALLGEAIAIYRSKDELHELIERFLGEPEECRRRAAKGREIVLGAHTFAHVADALLEEISSRCDKPLIPGISAGSPSGDLELAR